MVMEFLEDGELWARAQAGDAGAFGVLFDRHANSVYRYCFRRSADWAIAEDLTSVVFFEAWRRCADVELGEGRLLPWLLGVATNVIRNQRRSLRRYRAALERLPPLEFANRVSDPLVAPSFGDRGVGRRSSRPPLGARRRRYLRHARREWEPQAVAETIRPARSGSSD